MIGLFKECVTTEYRSLFPVNTFKKQNGKILINLWLFSIMQNRSITDQWEYPTKIERHFLIQPGQPIGIALTIFHSFSEFPNQGNELVCQKMERRIRSEYSDGSKRATSRGDSEYSGQKRTFL